MSVFLMAWRNVWRNRRRSIVTVLAMSLALTVMIQYSGLIEGYVRDMERNILDLELGDVQVHAPGYLDKPSIYTRIERPDQLVQAFERAGFRAATRLFAAGLAAAGETSAGVTFRGINVEEDAEVSSLGTHVARGKWLSTGDPSGVVIGERLAFTLGVKLGDEIVVLTQGADGSMANELYRVRGILKTVGDAVDRGGVFMLSSTFRELMVLPEGVHEITVRRPASMPLAEAASRLKALAPELEVKTWRELVPTLSSMLDSTRGAMFTMFLIVYIAIATVILNAMLMAVFERIREFGVLKALGVGPGGVFRLILVESAIQTGLALLVGGVASAPLCYYLATRGIDLSGLGGMAISGIAWNPIWHSVVDVKTVLSPVLTLVFVVFAAVLYPALKAALIRPVEAIHHQ